MTGTAALLLAHDPSLTTAQIRTLIRNSCDPIEQLRGRVGSGGRINAYAALLALRKTKTPVKSPLVALLLPFAN